MFPNPREKDPDSEGEGGGDKSEVSSIDPWLCDLVSDSLTEGTSHTTEGAT